MEHTISKAYNSKIYVTLIKSKNWWIKNEFRDLHPIFFTYVDVPLTVIVVVDRLLQEHAMTVEVQVCALNAKEKDLC